MSKAKESAISPRRAENFQQWYQAVVKAADLAETSDVRGCMVIKPWGYGIWELLQQALDKRIKETGHENAYFPLFIPLRYLEKEAAHIEGFAKECAVVTHHRLEQQDGRLVPAGELEEPLIVRPTSETIIGESFSRWVQSYRDLPILINQWANVVRWEMRTRVFLRTAEFLWQEGHTAHATEEEAREETLTMLEVYRTVIEDVLAMPVLVGEKSKGERFPGAVSTYCVEAMMQDRKALQAGTSHYLGQNFAKAADISFLTEQGEQQHAYTTSWGVSTRLIGGMIMTHSDDDGLRLPPKVATRQVVILPVIPKPELTDEVLAYAQELAQRIAAQSYEGAPIRVLVDKRDIRGGQKSWDWVRKGAPVRVEVGPRDIKESACMVMHRTRGVREKQKMSCDELVATLPTQLQEIQQTLYVEAKKFMKTHMRSDITTWGELEKHFTPKDPNQPEPHGGFVRCYLHDSEEADERLASLKLTVRCIPLDQSESEGTCIATGTTTRVEAIIAKAY